MHFQGSDDTSTDGGWLDGIRRGWRWKRVAGKCSTGPHTLARKIQAAGEETHVDEILPPVLWENLKISSLRTWWYGWCRKRTSPEKSPAVRVFLWRYGWSESFKRWERWPKWNTVTERFPRMHSRINRK